MPRSFSYEISRNEVDEFYGAKTASIGAKLEAAGAVGKITRRRSGLLMALEADVVVDGKKYHSMVEIDCDDPPIIVDSTCSCPEGFDCAHGAALALAAYAPSHPGSRAQKKQLSQTQQSQDFYQAAKWVHTLVNVANLANTHDNDDSQNGARSSKAKPKTVQRLVFVLSPGIGERLRLNMHLAKVSRQGLLIPNQKLCKPSLDRPQQYLRDEDILLLAKIQRLLKDSHIYFSDFPGVKVASEAWWPILKSMSEQGILFYNSFGKQQWAPAPVRLGEPRRAIPRWLEGENDILVPFVYVEPSPTFFSLLIPALYIDIRQQQGSNEAILGSIESDYPKRLLQIWQEGDAMTQAAATAIAPLLMNHDMPVRLPLPPLGELTEAHPTSVTPCLQITLRPPLTTPNTFFAYPQMLLGEVTFDYGIGVSFPPLLENADPVETIFVKQKRIVLHRLPEVEKQALDRLAKCGLQFLRDILNPSTLVPLHQIAVVPDASASRASWAVFLAGPAIEELRAEGWKVTLDDTAQFEVIEPEDTYEDIEDDPEAGNDWFRFETGIVHEGRRISLLPALAAAFAALPPGAILPAPESFSEEAILALPIDDEQTRFVKFPARRFYRVLHEIRHLLIANDTHKDTVTMHRIEAALLADSLGTTEHEALRDLGARLRGGVDATDPPPPPKELKATLRPYQTDGYHWLQFLTNYGLNGVLADDMGLGKTLQTLAHILREVETGRHNGKPSLVVAPTSVLPNWASEAAKFSPTLNTLVLHGKERSNAFENIASHQLVVTSYPLLVRDENILVKQDFHLIILDEAQAIKNPTTKMARAACRLKSAHRFCLSGTPLENHLGELWSLFRFLMPGFLSSHENFTKKFRTPIEKHDDSECRTALHRKVRPLILRRTKDEVAAELPPKTVITHPIEINDAQQELYESVRAVMDKRVRDALAAQGAEKSHIIFLQALLKLRQICCHPALLGDDSSTAARAPSAKLEYLLDMLPTLLEEGRRILLFSQFTSMLAIIREHIERLSIPYTLITGSTTDRRTPVEDFQKGRVPLFLISLKAGGTGLNLTAADTVIHYDPWWNPAVENQATDRAHRIGQGKPVFVHRLICKGTVEERIHELQARKAGLVASLLEGTSHKIQLDEQTINDLLAPLT